MGVPKGTDEFWEKDLADIRNTKWNVRIKKVFLIIIVRNKIMDKFSQ